MASSNLALRFPAEDPSSTRRSDLLGPAQEVDQLLRYRLRRVLVEKFGEAPHFEGYLAFIDRRAALYALTYAKAWKGASLDLFLGVVRHVIATRCQPPFPQPDIEGWLIAGRPSDTRRGDVWDSILQDRYGGNPPFTPGPRYEQLLGEDPELAYSVEVVDKIALTTQTELLHTYAAVSKYIEDINFELPPLEAAPETDH